MLRDSPFWTERFCHFHNRVQQLWARRLTFFWGRAELWCPQSSQQQSRVKSSVTDSERTAGKTKQTKQIFFFLREQQRSLWELFRPESSGRFIELYRGESGQRGGRPSDRLIVLAVRVRRVRSAVRRGALPLWAGLQNKKLRLTGHQMSLLLCKRMRCWLACEKQRLCVCVCVCAQPTIAPHSAPRGRVYLPKTRQVTCQSQQAWIGSAVCVRIALMPPWHTRLWLPPSNVGSGFTE